MKRVLSKMTVAALVVLSFSACISKNDSYYWGTILNFVGVMPTELIGANGITVRVTCSSVGWENGKNVWHEYEIGRGVVKTNNYKFSWNKTTKMPTGQACYRYAVRNTAGDIFPMYTGTDLNCITSKTGNVVQRALACGMPMKQGVANIADLRGDDERRYTISEFEFKPGTGP